MVDPNSKNDRKLQELMKVSVAFEDKVKLSLHYNYYSICFLLSKNT